MKYELISFPTFLSDLCKKNRQIVTDAFSREKCRFTRDEMIVNHDYLVFLIQ